MCGQSIDWPIEETKSDEKVETKVDEPSTLESEADDIDYQPHPIAENQVIISEMRERLSPITFLLTAVFAIVVVSLGILVLMYPADAAVEFIPTATPIPEILSIIQSPTFEPAVTEEPTATSVPEDTPMPTATLPPPRSHAVTTGETLFGLSLRYEVSMDSIAAENNLPFDTALQVSQELLIPWPTATPPLVAVAVEVGGERIVADPTDCVIYEIQSGDTLFGIAASFNVPSEAMLEVNRLTEVSILQPGDTICIPEIVYGSAIPATPGPSPTPGPTLPPSGPELLYPVANAVIDASDSIVSLQWVAVKDLESDEWYMIELTNLSEIDSHPRRSFTRQNSFQLPTDWKPTESADHEIRWRVSIVRITDQREDGSFIYTFGGESSDDAYFEWIVGS